MNPLEVASKFRIELRIVIASTEKGDDEALTAVQHSVGNLGTVVYADLKPYAKPVGSCMVRVEADCVGNHRSIVDQMVVALGGTGWALSGSDEECEAVWSPHEGAHPPVSALATWMHIQTIPLRALPALRRGLT